jgi:hypothetical protein
MSEESAGLWSSQCGWGEELERKEMKARGRDDDGDVRMEGSTWPVSFFLGSSLAAASTKVVPVLLALALNIACILIRLVQSCGSLSASARDEISPPPL